MQYYVYMYVSLWITYTQQASSPKYNLTTPDHVWILPSYYNPDWWKGGGDGYHSDQQTRTCTDEDMMDILNSVIFIDPVKYPPMVKANYNDCILTITCTCFRVLHSPNSTQHCWTRRENYSQNLIQRLVVYSCCFCRVHYYMYYRG